MIEKPCESCGLKIGQYTQELRRENQELRERAAAAEGEGIAQKYAELESHYFELNNDLAIANSLLTSALASRDAALAAQSAARAEAMEEAAKVAEDESEGLLKSLRATGVIYPDICNRGKLEMADIIAARIRSLAAEPSQKTADNKAGD